MNRIHAGFCTITKATRYESKRYRCYVTRSNTVRSYRPDSFNPIDVTTFPSRGEALAFVQSLLGIGLNYA